MAKRKRDESISKDETTAPKKVVVAKVIKVNGQQDVKLFPPTIQIVVGSYERVLHGITATIEPSSAQDVQSSIRFADTFLFNAHTSAIRCLALSPLPDSASADSQGVFLATGGSDEKINVYSLAASPVLERDDIPMPTLGGNKVSENPRNRELGTLLQHSSNITALHFPTRSKLLSASEDNTVSISRLKDLQVVSTIKAPRPKAFGQPSGDTAPPGMTPAGVNDFAIHPSMKLMLSVGRGEKCMRLWNLVTGKKAGVLNFPRDVLQSIKESKYSSGEGRKIIWNPEGTEFAVAFERGVVTYGQDSVAKCRLLPQPLTKIHQIKYLECQLEDGTSDSDILAVSTEDGRILFYKSTESNNRQEVSKPDFDTLNTKPIAQLGGKAVGISGRIKDFEILIAPNYSKHEQHLTIVTANSDGVIKIWQVLLQQLSVAASSSETVQVGSVVGSYETGSRITCLGAFFMLAPSIFDDDGIDFDGFEEGSGSDEDDSSGSEH